LIVGNTVIFKHAKEVPLSAKFIEKTINSCNLPTGVYNQIYGNGKIGDYLIHQLINLISFTGSTKVGKYIFEIAGKKFIKSVMELGGSAPGIVFEDAKTRDLFVRIGDLHLCVESRQEYEDESREINELAIKYSKSKSPVIRGRLSVVAQNLVRAIAAKECERIMYTREVDDLVCDGNLGLLDAIEKFDYKKGVKFTTYAPRRIWGAMGDAEREWDPFCRIDRNKINFLKEFMQTTKEFSGAYPSVDDCKRDWMNKGYNEEELYEFYKLAFQTTTQSLDDSSQSGRKSGDKLSRGELIADPRSINPSQMVLSQELAEIVERDLSAIPQRHRSMLRDYLVNENTLREVAQKVGLTESRACQLISRYFQSHSFFRRTREYLEVPEVVVLRV